MARKWTHETVSNYISSYGYKLISTDYRNVHEKVEIECNKGHRYKTSFGVFRRGFRCPECSGQRKYTYEEVKQYIESFGYKLHSETYKSANTRLDVECDQGHVYKVTFSDFKNGGKRCRKCYFARMGKEKAHSYEYVKNFVDNKGYVLLSKEYINSNQKLEIKCKNNHIWEASFDTFKKSNCPYCQNKVKYTHAQVKEYIEAEGYELLSESYINNMGKLLMRCPKGHEYYATFSGFKNDNCRCPVCRESKGEKQIKIILNKLNVEFKHQYSFKDCKFKNILPFDFYLPKYNLLIEYDGELHYKIVNHFGGFDGFVNTKIRDTVKNVYCKENNINLLRIPYWEFDNIEEILINQLKQYE